MITSLPFIAASRDGAGRMVKTAMSSDSSDPEESESWTKAMEKLILQQSLIDSSARTLKRLKESTSRLISTSSLTSLTNGINGETQSAIDDDIKLQEVDLYKASRLSKPPVVKAPCSQIRARS